MTSDTPSRTADTVVFIHGLYLNATSWDKWKERYEARGYRVIAPSWPGMDRSVEELRANPQVVANQDAKAVLDQYDKLIRDLDKPPIVMGHSFGGIFTQVMADRGICAAAVPVDSGGPRGVFRLPPSTLKANFLLLRNPIHRKVAVMPTEKQFHYGFLNTLTEADAKPYYEKYAVPGARNIIFTGAYVNFNPKTVLKVDYKNPNRCPMLFISGGKDHVIPPSINKENAGRYKTASPTDLKLFPDRAHFTAGLPGWEEVADYAIEWCERMTSK